MDSHYETINDNEIIKHKFFSLGVLFGIFIGALFTFFIMFIGCSC